MLTRGSGILMHISSLPSSYGIGTLGKAARDFADFLHASGFRYWQMLPLGPTGFGDSPYQSFSSFAGNPYFIDPDQLVRSGLLRQEEIDECDWGADPSHVDYGRLFAHRLPLLRVAYRRGYPREMGAVCRFAKEHPWLEDYALFMAFKQHFQMARWQDWPEEIRLRDPEAMAALKEKVYDDYCFYTYLQYLFYSQWSDLRDYIHSLGIELIGDLPIYVAPDSADVWAEPACFQLDANGLCTHIAGVPPDYFSENGQLWGNPLYRWDAMEADHYAWWVRRIRGVRMLYDIIRIDHFRGFSSYWSVPAGETTARGGTWKKGPGLSLLQTLFRECPDARFIAEDLGVITEDVRELLASSGLPGMKVLQFAFDDTPDNPYLPHNYTDPNCVCYSGTHDNATSSQWWSERSDSQKREIALYGGLHEQEGLLRGLLRLGLSSPASVFIAPMQDWLELGADARMNMPGEEGNWWSWRMTPPQYSLLSTEELLALNIRYARCPHKQPSDDAARCDGTSPNAASGPDDMTHTAGTAGAAAPLPLFK